MGRRPAPQVERPPNPFLNRTIRAPTPIRRTAPTKPAKRACPNKECNDPKIEDGICENCGTIVEESNIVSEVQFGETSQGAAVVQGSYIGADQGGARNQGAGLRGAGGNQADRERIQQEGKPIMQALSAQLKIPEATINSGVQILKLAASHNFIQGRRLDMVAAVCLYSACRKEKPCRVMLIDFADRIQVNVFKLGHTFKALHKVVTLAKDGIQPILPEDLIYRFAQKLDFGDRVTKVAEDAVRMVQRFSKDWMVMGRRPSGVCGACLILAARMNNFRRTVTEVVYIVKVTTNTIQKRLEEFKLTPSSSLTVEEFLNNEFLEQSHDPPSFYQKQKDFISNKKTRKRKRIINDDGEEEDGSEPNSRQATQDPNGDNAPPVELRRDADGFAIPPPRLPPQEIPIDPELIDSQTNVTMEQLVATFGDAEAAAGGTPDPDGTPDAEEGDNNTMGTGITKEDSPAHTPKEPNNTPVFVSEQWTVAEQELEDQVSEIISDPNTQEHALAYEKAEKRTSAYMRFLESLKDPAAKPVIMDQHIGEDEFEDDPEVKYCLLAPEDIAIKEKLWVNENRQWLRKQQLKQAAIRAAANGPPKARRNRVKKPRIGEGQTTPASTPGEAAVNVLKERAWSKKINYNIYSKMFDKPAGYASRLGSAVTSRAGSVALEELSRDGSRATSVASTSIADYRSPSRTPFVQNADGDSVASGSARGDTPAVSEVAEADDWRKGLQREKVVDEFGEVSDEDDGEDDYEQGDVADVGAFGNDDDDDNY